jgi:hypothetical protein
MPKYLTHICRRRWALSMKKNKNWAAEKMKQLILLLAILMTLFTLACNSTEGKGGGGIEPSATTPEIIDGFMCGGIDNDRPVDIDNDFFVDDVVYIWLSWVNVSGSHELKILWVDPNDKIIEAKTTFESKTGKMVNYMWLDTTLSAPTGRWVAEVYLDNVFVRSYGFWLNPKN